MSTPENNEGLDLTNASVVDALLDNLDNKEIANLALGSPEQKAALDKLSGKTEEESATSDEEERKADDEETEDDESEESEESGEEDKDDEVKKKPKKGIQKRFDEMTTKIRDLEAKLAAKDSGTKQPEEDKVPQFDKAKPKMAQYESLEDYYEAVADWTQEKKEFERSYKANNKKIEDEWDARVAEFKKTTEDFDDVVNRDSLLKANISNPALLYIVRQEQSPAITYKLLTDPAKAEAFKKADPVEQVEILTEIKLGLTSKNNKTTAVTNAPEPPPTKKKVAATAKPTYRDDMSFAEFEKALDRELKAKSRRR